ncbi:N-acetylmuramic acid 6-phosphate etherase [Lachnoclostridium phytofermentans]|uniref:N-acetylmuramic acid 6-phosphate etherase n=1 Tax=Lachnoclostridium phytofermentans (strain ATCC 700394 / DSM 18823 / ISDg) TaxID=357809 RepID=A9KMQ4_LACP7|nr:N-acetylmuramic acid 6-phosphate etherase [Lachnoclostridium phytofermentans]ABX41499.1 glucokinase regulatory-like protein [Lachnoclostridium phytofermentans ISDg]
MVELNILDTEQKNERTKNIDILSTLEVLKLMNDEDKKVAYAVEKELENIQKAVDITYEKMAAGGRLIYSGCGTSGRLGILDAVECPPTFGTDPELVQALIAGGVMAFVKAVEGAEDNQELGAEDLKAIGFSEKDILVGIAASGRTPYVIGAVSYAKSIGAKTISVTCSTNSPLTSITDVAITLQTGPEVITGSTRLKSGTAQKMVLNMLSTSVMIKLGKVYGNLMVDLKATNEKLVERAVMIVRTITEADDLTARQTLEACDYSAKTAIVMLKCNLTAAKAEEAINKANGHISSIIS